MSADIFEVLDDLRVKVNEANVKLTKIEDAMFGNNDYGHQGLVRRFVEQEDRLRRIERTRISVWQMVMSIMVLVMSAVVVDGRSQIGLSFPVSLVLSGGLIVLLISFLIAYSSSWRS